jgi:hypothetical protein
MSKRAITIIADEESYSNLSTFDSIEELNKTVRFYKEKFRTDVSKSTILVLDQLHRYSCVYLGVSFRTKNNIAKSLDISRKTVQRACRLLEDLGTIKQHETKRKSDMRQSSNVIQILPIEEDVQQDQANLERKCPTRKTTSVLKQNNTNIRTEPVASSNNRCESSLESKYIPNWINVEFYKAAKPYFELDKIEEMWKISVIHSRINKLQSNHLILASLDSLRVLVRKMKKTLISNPMGFYNGVSLRIQKGIKVRSMFEDFWFK